MRKSAYKKYAYNKFKESKRITHQYVPIKIINDAIVIPKESRFMIRGKPKKSSKKGKIIMKREITYNYKSQISQGLLIGGKINNIIERDSLRNNINSNLKINNEIRNKSKYFTDSMMNKRKIQSISNANTKNKTNLINVNINSKSNISNKKEDKRENKSQDKKEKNRTSNLVKSESEPIKQEYISIRRKYTNSRSNKNILIEQKESNKLNNFYMDSPGYNSPPLNNSSKEKIVKTGTSSANMSKNQIFNFISPKRDEKIDIEKKKENNKNNLIGRNNILLSKYEQCNNDKLIKSENNYIGKIHSYFSSKASKYNNNNESSKTPLTNENNNLFINNNYYNKSHTTTSFLNKQEDKNDCRVYISSNKTYQRNESNESVKKKSENNSNSGRIYVSTTHSIKKSTINNEPKPKMESKKTYSNITNTIPTATNFKKDKAEDKSENKNASKELKNNSLFYSSSFAEKKSGQKQILNNNIFINSKTSASSLNNKKDKDNKSEIEANINRINILNGFTNSPVILKNIDRLDPKSESNNMNKNLFNYGNNIIENESINNMQNSNILETQNINKNNKNEKNINDENEEKNNLKEEKKSDESHVKYENKTPENNKFKKFLPNFGGSLTTLNFINSGNESGNEEKNNVFSKYSFGGNEQLSCFQKSYLNSYKSIGPRPELSDFSKKYLSINYSTNFSNRPELSNITRAYLISQSPVFENNDDK